MRISDWSSDVCSSDLETRRCPALSCCSGRAHSWLRLSRLFSRDQITIDADQVDHEQNHILRPDPLPLIIQEPPPDQGNRGSAEDQECPARGSPPDVERNNKEIGSAHVRTPVTHA